MILIGSRKCKARRRGAGNGANSSLPPSVLHMTLNETVIMEETPRAVAEGAAWMFLVTGLCFDSNFTARAITA
jgi:hypothetical protein